MEMLNDRDEIDSFEGFSIAAFSLLRSVWAVEEYIRPRVFALIGKFASDFTRKYWCVW